MNKKKLYIIVIVLVIIILLSFFSKFEKGVKVENWGVNRSITWGWDFGF